MAVTFFFSWQGVAGTPGDNGQPGQKVSADSARWGIVGMCYQAERQPSITSADNLKTARLAYFLFSPHPPPETYVGKPWRWTHPPSLISARSAPTLNTVISSLTLWPPNGPPPSSLTHFTPLQTGSQLPAIHPNVEIESSGSFRKRWLTVGGQSDRVILLPLG